MIFKGPERGRLNAQLGALPTYYTTGSLLQGTEKLRGEGPSDWGQLETTRQSSLPWTCLNNECALGFGLEVYQSPGRYVES